MMLSGVFSMWQLKYMRVMFRNQDQLVFLKFNILVAKVGVSIILIFWLSGVNACLLPDLAVMFICRYLIVGKGSVHTVAIC